MLCPAIAHLYKAKQESGIGAAAGGRGRGVAASSTFHNDLALAESAFEVANKGFVDRSSVLDMSGHDSPAFVPALLGKVAW